MNRRFLTYSVTLPCDLALLLVTVHVSDWCVRPSAARVISFRFVWNWKAVMDVLIVYYMYVETTETSSFHYTSSNHTAYHVCSMVVKAYHSVFFRCILLKHP